MTTRFVFLLVVTFVSACGAGARAPAARSEPALVEPATAEPAARGIAAQNPEDDYVVGPFEAANGGVRTYYIVRN